MKKAEVMSFGKPDEVRKFPKGHMELIKIGGATVGRAVFQPGWKWSDSIQPMQKLRVVKRHIFSIMLQECLW